MSKVNKLLSCLVAATPGEWSEDNEGFITSGNKTVADARCDIELYSEANTDFIILAKNAMPDILYALQTLQKMIREDQSGGDAFGEYGHEAREALRKLEVRV